MKEINELREIIHQSIGGLVDENNRINREKFIATTSFLLDQIEEQFKQNEVNILTLKGIVASQKQEIKDFFEGVKEANKTQAA